MQLRKVLLLLSIAFIPYGVMAQQPAAIKNVVFEGAGIRGIAYCGAIQALEERNMIAGIEKVGGTSAGAITALCVSLGYSASEIRAILHETNFKQFNDGRFLFPGGINRMSKYFGWYRGDRLVQWLEKIIEAKTGNANISFADLSTKGFKDLYITATALNQQKLVILSRYSYPSMRVKDAVRISVSIPFYFEAVFVNADGKVFKHPKQKQGLDVMVDGGFTGNFPLRIFDSSLQKDGSTAIIANRHTIGFRIDSDKQIVADQRGQGLATISVTNFKSYVNAFYTIILENLNRQTLTADDWQRTVSISDGSIGPRIRKLSIAEINTLLNNGRQATQQFFDTINR